MKAISLWQPWATLIAAGLKTYETRSWSTSYRGLLAIHAAKRPIKKAEVEWILQESKDCSQQQIQELESCLFSELPLGCVVAIANLTDCIHMTEHWIECQDLLELSLGDWDRGRFAWKLEDIKPTPPIPFKGSQGLWELPGCFDSFDLIAFNK